MMQRVINFGLDQFLKSKGMTMSKYMSVLITTTSKKILNYSPQLYLNRNPGVGKARPYPYASSILLSFNDHYFLVTAGHALQKNVDPTKVGVMLNDTFLILEGEMKVVDPTLNKTNDKIDLAIVRLEKPVVADLQTQYSFLDINQIEIDHKISQQPQYLLVGFPAETSKLKLDVGEIIVDPFIYLTNVVERKIYQELDYNPKLNMILQYDHNQIVTFDSGNISRGPDAHGVSGSGLWYLPKFIINDFNDVPFKLVGIMIEWWDDRHFLIATRIHIVTELIRNKFKLPIPSSTIMRTK
jgi:hypothetical protein